MCVPTAFSAERHRLCLVRSHGPRSYKTPPLSCGPSGVTLSDPAIAVVLAPGGARAARRRPQVRPHPPGWRTLRRIREGSLNFRNTQHVATACGAYVPRHTMTRGRKSTLLCSSFSFLPSRFSLLHWGPKHFSLFSSPFSPLPFPSGPNINSSLIAHFSSLISHLSHLPQTANQQASLGVFARHEKLSLSSGARSRRPGRRCSRGR